MNCEFYKRKVDTEVELLADILDAAVRNKREDKLNNLQSEYRVATFIKVEGGIFENLF